MMAYLHEVILGVEHAGAYGFVVPVGEGDHVETDGLGDCQEERQQPNGHDLYDGEQRDAHALNSAPGGHGSVPERDTVYSIKKNINNIKKQSLKCHTITMF